MFGNEGKQTEGGKKGGERKEFGNGGRTEWEERKGFGNVRRTDGGRKEETGRCLRRRKIDEWRKKGERKAFRNEGTKTEGGKEREMLSEMK